MVTDTEQTTRIHITRDQQRKATARRTALEAVTQAAAAFSLGVLVVIAVEISTPLVATQVTLGLVRAGFVGAAVVAFIAWSTPRAVDDLARRIGEQATRNRNATEACTHSQDRLRADVDQLRRAYVVEARQTRDELTGLVNELADMATVLAWVCELDRRLLSDRTGVDPRTLAAIDRLNERLNA